MRLLARNVAVALLVCLAALPLAGQTCPTPVVIQTAGSNPTCSGVPVTLDTGSGWASYLWSNGATTRTMSDSPSAATNYFVTTTDASGCQATSQPYHVDVTYAAASPTITISSSCSNGGSAHIDSNPSGWSGTWSATNAAITRQDGQSVDFTPTGTDPVTVTLQATDANECPATVSATANVNAIAPPVMHLEYPAVCPGSSDFVWIDSPSDPNVLWRNAQWSIVHGTLFSTNGTSVSFSTDTGGQPATLTVTATDSHGCTASASITTAVRSIPPPVIHLEYPAVCPGSGDFVWIDSPADTNTNWSNLQWTIANGTLNNTSGTSVSFNTSPNGQPATLTVTATDNLGCTNTASITTQVRSIPPPVIHLENPAVCPGSSDFVWIDSPADTNTNWSNVRWTIANGTLNNTSGTGVSFNTSPNGQPATLTVTATDNLGCTNTASITTQVRSIPPPVVHLEYPAVCPGSGDFVWINSPADTNTNWSNVQWTIVNGTLNNTSGTSVSFNTSLNGQPATLTVTATDNLGCTNTASITTQVRSIPPPVIHLENPAVCPGSGDFVWIDSPADTNTNWSNVQWTIVNGTLNNTSGTNVSFNSDPTGQPATLTVTATDSVGCSSTASIDVPVSNGKPAINVDTQPTCAGSSAQVSLAPPSDPSVTWQNIQWTVTGGTILSGATSSVMHLQTDPAGGTAVVTVSAQTSQGCSGTASTTLTTTAVTPSLSTGPTSICAGGSAEVDLNDNRSLFQSFNWTVTHATIYGISTNPYVLFTADGTGDVTATLTAVTVSGCTGTASVTYRLGGPDATITAPASDSFCVGSQSTASVPDAGSFATYQWTLNGSQLYGANARTVNFTPSTTSIQLGVTVSLNGCSSSGSKSLTALAAPQATLSAPSHICYLSTGNTATLSDPGPGVTIEWPANTASLRVTPTADPHVAHFDSVPYQYFNGYGAITAKLTNASGCVSYVVALVVVDVPYASAGPGGPTTFCQGGNVTIYGGPIGTGYSYLWSNGATTANINATQSGSYSVTVTDPAGCSLTSSAVNVTVNTPAPPTITANGPTTFCGTGSVTLTSSAGASYSWSNGATTQAVTVSSGSYTVTVTDANGCSATSAPTVVTDYSAMQTPTIIAFGPTAFCQGGSVNLSASAVNAVSYLWSNGATTFTINATAAGSYTCTVTDGNGCSATSVPKVVTVYPLPPNPTVTAAGPTTFCQGGSVTLNAPAGYATYWWSTGEGTPSITVTQTGTYSVDVKDANGCWASSGTAGAVHVTVLSVPTPTITAGGPTTFCAGGSVTLTAPSGYTYSWSNGATTQSITATTSAAYTVTVTGTNGCSATSAATNVTVNANPPTPVVTASGPTSFCAPGSVTLTAPSGYTYSWSNGATTQSISVNASGSFTVTVTNASGCTATSTPAVVTSNPIPAKPTVTVGGPTTFCAGGSVTLTASAGSSYGWSNGMTTQSISVSLTGNYYVAVYDANGCGAPSDPVSVTVNPRPVATITFSPPSSAFCDGGQPIVLTSSLAASYLWSTGQTTRSVSFNQAGTYNVTVTVTDANGCSATSQPRLFQINTLPPATITANGPTTFCTPGSVLLTAPIPDSLMLNPNTDGPYIYLWSTGATTSSITATQSGSYSVTITNYYGCSATSAPTVVTANPTPSATITPSGPTSFCTPGSVTLSAPAGAGYSYQWTNGATTQSINATTTAFYNVTVTSAAGCSATGSPVFVNADSGPTATITPSGATSFCAGIGTVTLSAPSGSYNYRWSTGATTSSINVTTSGSYSVTVTDGLGCSTTSAPTVVTANALPPQPVITASGPTTFCAGGSVTLTAPAGYTYFWGTGDHTQSIVATFTGGYQVTVRDANGCQSTSAVVNVTVNPLPATPAITAGGPTTFCAGGSVTLTAPNGYTYSWSNGATTQAINATAGGAYSVTVTNANGCSATSAATVVTVNAPPVTPAITASGPTTFCAGGSVTLTAPSGYAYFWTGGWTTQSISVGSSGSYSVTVRDANGCSSTSAPAVVTAMAVPPTPTINVTPSPMICDGTTATLTAPAGYSYLWSNGATTQSITSSTSSSFTVTVTDANGCSATSYTAYVTVYPVPPVPTLTASGPTTFCAGGSVTLTAQTGYTNYLWSNGNATWVNGSGSPANAITVSSPGTYTVQVSGDNFCYATSAPMVVTVNSPPPTPAITASGPTAFCTGGAVTLNAPSGYSYSWSNGATTRSINVTTAGSYNVTVTDANGCSSASQLTWVTTNANPIATITALGPTTFCAGGSVTLTAPSGNPSYSWSNGATSQSINVTTSGSYSVTVTNGSGCSATSSPTVVTVNALPATPVITAGGPTTFCAGGSVTLTAPSGFTYSWSNGATTQSITVTTTDTYSVTVRNAQGCQAVSAPTSVTVNANPATTITASGPTTFCSGGGASVTLTAAAAAGWTWSNGATTQSITVAASGSYSVTVRNSVGCSATSAAVGVTVYPTPVATITASGPTTFCQGGSVVLTAPDGYSEYFWSDGTTSFGTSNRSITVLASGTYTVTLYDPSGCSATSSQTVVTVNVAPAKPTITAGGPTTFCAGSSVTLTASSGASYLWSTGATTPSIAASASGNYSVTVTNANGCSATSSPTAVTVNALPTATITAGGPTTFCVGGSVTLTSSSGASYLWSTGATTQAITASTTGSYSVTVTGSNGCAATSSPAVVTANALPAATITAGGPTTFCTGGSVTLTASSGASYLWSTGATTQAITASASGNYSVTVTSANGCSATSAPTSVTVDTPQTATITPAGSTTFCGGSFAHLTASSGASYLWSTGSTSQSIDVNATGNYSVTVTDANGCSTTSAPTTATMQPYVIATITPNGPTTFCAGGSVTLTASGGVSYHWLLNGETTPSIVVTQAGNYFVTVTNAQGCSSSTSWMVYVNPNPQPVVTAGGPTTFCAGSSVTLTSSSASSYLWSNGATTPSIAASSSGSYSVTVTDANGCRGTSAPTIVTVNPAPATITAGGPTTFCSGGSVTLTASSGTSYLWSTGATTQSIAASASGNFAVTVTNANGCSATSSPTAVTVNANPTATITASGPTTYCIGGSVTLTASSGASYWWSNGQTTPSITISDSFSYSGSYSVTVTNANGCSTTSSPMTVTSVAGPTPGISYGQTTFCAGGSVTLTASGGTSYLWSTGATTTSIVVSSSGSYSAIVKDASGCSATTASVPVTVNAKPTATITAGGPTAICAGGSVTLTASSGASYLWSTGATTQAISATTAGSYSVTVTNASGCSGTSAATVVTVNANPTATITAGGPTTFCAGGSVTLTSSSGTSYLWSNGATTQAISATTSASYTVTVTNATGCHVTSAPTVVTVKPHPTAAVSGGGAICPGASSTITATLTGTAPWSVKWSDNVTQPVSSGTTATRSVSPSVTTTYTVTSVTDALGCAAVAGSGSAVVTVNAAASITTQPVNKTTTRNTSVTLTVVAAGTSPISYQWFQGNGTSISGATSSSYTTSFPSKGTNTFYVTVWNACNATHVKSSTVTVTVN